MKDTKEMNVIGTGFQNLIDSYFWYLPFASVRQCKYVMEISCCCSLGAHFRAFSADFRVYWVVAHFSAQLLMYHHRLPSPASFFESQDAPGKSLVSLRIENGMVPVSPTGTSPSLPNIEVMGTTYKTMLRSWIMVESHWSSHAAKYKKPSKPSKINNLRFLSSIPGRRGPEYSSITETNTHECRFQPMSVLDSTSNRRRTLQNHLIHQERKGPVWNTRRADKDKVLTIGSPQLLHCKWPRGNTLFAWVLCVPY